MSSYVILLRGEIMARVKKSEDSTILEMALVGYQIERQKIDDKIRQIEAALKGKKTTVASTSTASEAKTTGRRRVLSPAARKRIAAAQKKRWAEHRKKAAQGKAE
jgi:hypothetical protein